MSVASAASRETGGGHDSNSVLDSATIPDNVSVDDPKYAFLNELLQQREQDLLAAADIGEMLLEKNRGLNQRLADLQALLDEQRRRSTRSDGLALSSDGGDDDDDDDDSSEDEKLNADGSVVLTGMRARVSLLHETQMTQRRTSGRGQAVREAVERQEMLDHVTKEAEHADETIAALLADGLMLSSLLHWRRLTDRRQNAELQKRGEELDSRIEAADAAALSAADTVSAMAAEQRLAQEQAAVAANSAKETIAALHQDLHRTQTIKMQEKEDFETQIAALHDQISKQNEEAEASASVQKQAQGDKARLEAELNTARSELVLASKETTVLQALISKQGEDVQSSQSLLQHLEEDNRVLQGELDKLRLELEAYSSKMEAENSEKLVLKGLMEDAKMDAESRVTKLSAAKDKELTDMKAALQDTQDERQQVKLALKEAREMMEHVESQHQIKLTTLQGELEAVENDLADTKAAALNCQRDLEELVLEGQNKLIAAHAEMAASRDSSETQLHAVEKQMAGAQAEAAAAADSAKQQQRDLEFKVKELEIKVKTAEIAIETAAREATEREKQMKRTAEEKIRALKQETRKSLLVLSERSYHTESCVADVEVEVAKYSTHIKNWHYLEIAALERQMLSASSQAKLEEQKHMLEGMKKEEDFKVQLQLLTASLAQKEEHIDALCRERTQKDAQATAAIKGMTDEKLAVLSQADDLYAKLQESLKATASLQKELNERLRDAGAENERTAEEAESLRATLREREQTIKVREEQAKKLSEIVKQSEAQLAAGEGVLRDAQEELAECKRRLAQSKRAHAEAQQESMRERDAFTEEAASNMLQLEAKIDSDRGEIKKLTALLREAKDNFRNLEQSKTSAVSQLEARCDTLERGMDVITSESSTASQEMSQLRKKMQESYVQAQREKNEMTDQLKLMEDRLKRLRLEAEDNEKHLKEDLREREAENKNLAASLHEQTSVNQTMEQGSRRLHDTLRSQLMRLRDDLDSSRVLDASLIDETAQAATPDKSSAVSPSYNRSILSRSVKGESKPDDNTALLDDFSSEIERITAAIHNVEAQNVQLLAKLSTLDSSLQGQKTLNETLQLEVAQANEESARVGEVDKKAKKMEAENARCQEKIAKLEEKTQKLKKIAHEEVEKERSVREKEMVVLEEEVSRLINTEKMREVELAAAQEAVEEAKRETATRVEEVQTLREEVGNLKTDMLAAADARASLKEQVDMLKQDLEQTIHLAEAKDIQVKEKESELLKTCAEISRLSAEVQRLEGDASSAQKLVSELKEDLLQKTHAANTKDSEVKEKDSELTTARAEIFRLGAEMQHLESEQGKVASDVESAHAQQVAELERQVQALHNDVREANEHLVSADSTAKQLEVNLARAEQDKNLAEQMLSNASEKADSVDTHVDLPQLQDLQNRFDEYRILAAAQAQEATLKIKGLERQLDDRISEAGIANDRAFEEMREREKERQDRARSESEAAAAAADFQHQRLRQMSSTAALKKQADLHQIETDELYCQMIVLRNNQAQLLEELVALKMQQQTDKENVSVTQLRRKLQEKLGKARQTEQNTIKEELQRVTSIASNKRRELLKEDCSYAA